MATSRRPRRRRDLRPDLPDWAEELRRYYLDGSASQFLIHNNVKDLVALSGDYVTLKEFLHEALLRVKDLVVYYDISRGITFPSSGQKQKFYTEMNAARALRGLPNLPAHLPSDPSDVFPHLDMLMSLTHISISLVVDNVEMLAPSTDLAFLGKDERNHLVTMERWSRDPKILGGDHIVLLITEHMLEVHPKLRNAPMIRTVDVPLPAQEEREEFINWAQPEDVELEMTEKRFGELASGLTRTQIDGILREAARTGGKVTFDLVRTRKKDIIQGECAGLLEFIESDHNMSHVGGMEAVKKRLMRVATNVREGNTRRVPMGILFVGPMGTGKSFLAEAFASESGLTCVKLKNFRDKWVGSTEANLERIINIIQAMGYVLVIMDEVDRSLVGRSVGESDGGTSSRVMARLKEFMSDTSHRGRIVFLVMTNRSDKLDVDLKRPGRFDMKIPFFVPGTDEERELIFNALVRKNKVKLAEDVDIKKVITKAAGYTGAEIEAVLLLGEEVSADAGKVEVTLDDIDAALDDFIPSRDKYVFEFMELLAVFECSSRSLLPERYKGLTNL